MMIKKLLTGVFLLVIFEGSTAQIQFGGYVQTDIRMFLQNENRFYWNENRLKLEINADPSDKAHVYSEIWIRNFGFPNVSTSSDLMEQEKDKVSPWSLLLREVYSDLYGFISPDLDIRIGLQRISWGTADRFNPTDNLNPDDLEDIWDFGRHLGSGSIKASYYFSDFVITGVFVPIFTPATFPIEEWAGAFSPSIVLPPGNTISKIDDKVVTPRNNLKESSMFGFKVAKNLLGYDFSLSYFKGRDDIPLVRKVEFSPSDTPGVVDVSMEYFYPRIEVLGLDVAGAAGDVGFWIEGALFYPEKREMTYISNGTDGSINRSLRMGKDPYFKYVIGADYTFRNGWYINAQYIRGIFHEREESELGNYFMFALKKKLYGNRFEIIPVGGGIEIRRFNNLMKSYAYIFNPEVRYHPIDNAQLSTGFRVLDGKRETVFGRLKDNDEIYLRVRYSF